MAKSTVALNNMSHVFSNNIDINRILLGVFLWFKSEKNSIIGICPNYTEFILSYSGFFIEIKKMIFVIFCIK